MAVLRGKAKTNIAAAISRGEADVYGSHGAIYGMHGGVYPEAEGVYQWAEVIYGPHQVIYEAEKAIYDPQEVIYRPQKVILRSVYQFSIMHWGTASYEIAISPMRKLFSIMMRLILEIETA